MNLNEKCEFTAILTPHRRDIKCVIPRRLMTNVKCVDTGEEFRDHVWVQESRTIKNILPIDEEYKVLIRFTAIPSEYISSTGKKIGLTKVRNIQIIKKLTMKGKPFVKHNRRAKKNTRRRVA